MRTRRSRNACFVPPPRPCRPTYSHGWRRMACSWIPGAFHLPPPPPPPRLPPALPVPGGAWMANSLPYEHQPPCTDSGSRSAERGRGPLWCEAVDSLSASLKRLGVEGAAKLLSDKMERPPFLDFVNELLDNVSTPIGVITSVALTGAYRRFGRSSRV